MTEWFDFIRAAAFRKKGEVRLQAILHTLTHHCDELESQSDRSKAMEAPGKTVEGSPDEDALGGSLTVTVQAALWWILQALPDPLTLILAGEVKRAENLRASDAGMLSAGASDPYCLVRCGAEEFRTRTIRDENHPEWEETFTFRHAIPARDAA